jgi:5'-nucleotidase
VTFGQVFTMQPFGNDLVVMTLSGAQLKALLESQLKPGASRMITLQPSQGLRYVWHAGAPAGSRVDGLTLQGEPIAADRSYRVAVNNFLAEGGDGFTTLLQGTERSGGGPDLDALLDYLKSAPVHAPSTEARITLAP